MDTYGNLQNQYSPELFFTLDKSKIIIKIDDIKRNQKLQKYIRLDKLLETEKIYLTDLSFKDQNEVIKLFLKEYNFIIKIANDEYFNYTKLYQFWKHNTYFIQYFSGMKPDLTIKVNDKENEEEYFHMDKIDSIMLNYIGVLFFSAYSKIENEKVFVQKTYDFFTDCYFDGYKFGVIEDFQEFFVKQFLTFINTTHGSFFGSYNFGSNLKNVLYSKEGKLDHLAKMDIEGFVNDISVLYNTFLKLDYIEMSYSEDTYTLTINLGIILNDKQLDFVFIKKD